MDRRASVLLMIQFRFICCCFYLLVVGVIGSHSTISFIILKNHYAMYAIYICYTYNRAINHIPPENVSKRGKDICIYVCVCTYPTTDFLKWI